MTSKKFINSVNNVVHETLSGLCLVFPQLQYHESKRVVLVPNWNNRGDKVSIICGGGSGHEPFAAGFVGSGMLTASIAGGIFAAPPANHIFYALKCVTGNGGTMVIIPNYTGDCLNFGIAIEKFRQTAGKKIFELVVGDDCSIPTSEQGRAGKRGLVGMLFVIKIAGALAEVGKSIEEVFHHAKNVSNSTATYGACLHPCALPGQGPMFELPSDEVEIGLGVHGEAGYDRIKIQSASEIVEIMLENLCKSLSLTSGDFVAVLINNFGAASQLEQGIVAHEVVTQLKKKNIHPLRVYSGVLMTSLDSSGVHVSILKLINDYRDIYINCLDEKTDAPCWPGCAYSLLPKKIVNESVHEDERVIKNIGPKLSAEQTDIFKKCLANACRAILKNEVTLNDLDRGCGDGDCGSTHKLLVEGILASLDTLNTNYPASALMELSAIAEGCMGGTSGAVYSLMFTTMASTLSQEKNGDWSKLWLQAWQCAIDSVMKYSKARLGDRTMLDALSPACATFREYLLHGYRVAIEKAAEAARNGCESTRNMIPRAGRAAYVKQSEFLREVDAGAFGVIIWINAISEILMGD